MTKFSLQTKTIAGGLAIGAVTEDGDVVAEWFKTASHAQRTGRGSYDAHRVVKGDTTIAEDHFEFVGRHADILAAVQTQLPKALIDAKWSLRVLNEDDHFAVFNFLRGLAGGCCWFGNTPAKTVAACKRVSGKMTFEAVL